MNQLEAIERLQSRRAECKAALRRPGTNALQQITLMDTIKKCDDAIHRLKTRVPHPVVHPDFGPLPIPSETE